MTRLAHARLARRMTQRELAERAAVPQSFIASCERGYVPTRPERLEAIADALDMTRAQLFPADPFDDRMPAALAG